MYHRMERSATHDGYAKLDQWMEPGPSAIPPMTDYEKMVAARKKRFKPTGSKKPPLKRRSASSAAAMATALASTQKKVITTNGRQLTSAPIGTTVAVRQLSGPLVPDPKDVETDEEGEDGGLPATQLLRTVDESSAIASAMHVGSAAAAASAASASTAAKPARPLNNVGAYALESMNHFLLGSIDLDEKQMKHTTAFGLRDVPIPTRATVTIPIIRAHMPEAVSFLFQSESLTSLTQLDITPFNEYGFWVTWRGPVKADPVDNKKRVLPMLMGHSSHKNTAYGPTDAPFAYKPHIMLLDSNRFYSCAMPELLIVSFTGTKRQFGCVSYILKRIGFECRKPEQTTVETGHHVAQHTVDAESYTTAWVWNHSPKSAVAEKEKAKPVTAAASSSASTTATAAPAKPKLIINSCLEFDDFPDEFPPS